MKNVFKTLAILLTLNTSVMAQKGFNVEKEIIVNVSAEKLWELIGPGFIEVYKWSSQVDHASGSEATAFEGAVCSERSCDVSVKGFSTINERVTAYNESKMNLVYEVFEGMPGFVTKAINDWTVVSLGANKSKLVMKARFDTKGLMGAMMKGMMRKKMDKALGIVLNDAKYYAETGTPSELKQTRVEKMDKKKNRAA